MPLMFGCIPCTPTEVADDRAIRPLERLIGGQRLFRAKVDLRPHLDEVVNQLNTNSCVGNAVSSAMVVSSAAKGAPIKRPSRRWLYAVARYVRERGVLRDEGSSVKAMCLGAEVHGIVSEERLPFEPAAINEPPPFDADVAGQDALFRDYYRAGDDPEDLRRALERSEVPTFAIPVHKNFVDWSSDEPYLDVDGDFLGYHMLAAVGFDGDTFDILNSWGPTWCREGFVRMSASFIQRHAFDRYVIRAAPNPR